MPRKTLISAVSLLWALLLALDIAPVLRGDYGWRWPYEVPKSPERLLPFIISLIVFVTIGLRLVHLSRARWLLGWAMVGSVGLTLTSIYITEPDVQYELYTRTISGGTTGWHYGAADIDDLKNTLSNWPEFMHQYIGQSSHMTTSPPGMPLIYYTTNQVLAKSPSIANLIGRPLRANQCHNDRIVGYSLYKGYSNAELASAWLGMLMPVWGALVIFPLYWIGRKHYNNEAARWSVLWWALVPSAMMFTPNPTPIYALLGLLVIGLLAEGLQRQKPQWVIAAGVVMSIASFLHFTTLPIIFLAGLFTLGIHWIQKGTLKKYWSLLQGIWFGIGLISVWVVFYLWSGVTFFEILQQSLDEHLALDRPYWPWLTLHLNDFFMFTGWPLALLGLWGLFTKRQALSSGTVLSLSTVVTLLGMDISGTTQGESGRIWLFLTPFMLLVAADALKHLEFSGRTITTVQAILLLTMVALLRVIGSGLTRPPAEPPRLEMQPETAYIPNGSVFGEVLQLQSFTGHIENETLMLWLNWVSDGQLEIPYYLGFLPVAPDGQAASKAFVDQPFNSKYPITCWLPENGLIQSRFEIPLEFMQEGEWWISLSLINGQTGEKLSIRGLSKDQEQQIGIGPFR